MILPQDNVPTAGEVVLDHIGLFVPDMTRAARAMERLGFRLTPLTPQRHMLAPGEPLVPAGTANRLGMLRLGYIEILTPVAETPVAEQLRRAIDRYTGLHLIAFGTGDAAASHAHLAEAGFAPQPVIHLERTVAAGGGDGLARFSVVRVPPGTMAEGRIQYCRHHTPELVWQERWLDHPNGAQALTDVLLGVDDPAEVAARFGRFTGRSPRRAAHHRWWLELDRGRLVFLDPPTLAQLFPEIDVPGVPFMAAFALAVDDLGTTRAALDHNGAGHRDLASGAIVAATPEGISAIACFLEPDAPPPWLAP